MPAATSRLDAARPSLPRLPAASPGYSSTKAHALRRGSSSPHSMMPTSSAPSIPPKPTATPPKPPSPTMRFSLRTRRFCFIARSSFRKLACRHKRSEEHTSELQSRLHLVCRLLLEKKNSTHRTTHLVYYCIVY